MPNEDKNIGDSLVLDLSHVKTLYKGKRKLKKEG